ncbi:MAG: HU family DNA-binding protein [Alphaproteobacteria bacterium]|nr:HU family DNA-binding protein [Alphaproteobacteria bacterium]
MTNQTITRASIVKIASDKTGLSKHLSSQMFETMLDMIISELCDEQSVKLSTFGSFIVRRKKQRMGRNPKTGIDAVINARKVISFRPSHILRMHTNISTANSSNNKSKTSRERTVQTRA